jgi:hypothetical protein
MSESTQENSEQNPFTRPGFIISAALVLAIVAAAVIIFLVPKGNPQAEPAATTTPAAPTNSSTATSGTDESICGLPSSDNTALGTAPKSTWTLVGRIATPTDPAAFGPGITDPGGFRSCFAHSPTGALYAAANLVALGAREDVAIQRKLIEDLVVPGPGRDVALKDMTTPSGGSSSIQIRGFVIKAYSPSQAHVDLAFETPSGALGHAVLPLRWLDGDWKVEIADSGELINDVAQLSDLNGYISWSGT